MKSYFKKISAVLMLCALLLSLCTTASAQTDLVFLCINDSFVRSMTSSNMPIKVNNSMYISYRYLARIRSIKYFYNEDIHTLKIYNSSSSLIFDIDNAITYDQDGKIYSYQTERRGSTLYVPIEFICRMFNVYYSQTNTSMGQVIRISSMMSQYSDSELISVNRDVMQEIYTKYYSSADTVDPIPDPGIKDQNTTPSEPDDEPKPDETSVRKTVYPAFVGSLGSSVSDILDHLSAFGVNATFFISSNDLSQNGDLLRRIVGEGHSIGAYVSAANPVAEAEGINSAFSSLAMRRSRLVLIKEGSRSLSEQQRAALSDAGYRIWDASVDPGSAERNSYSISLNAEALLDKAPRASVLRLYINDNSAGAVSSILSALRQKNWYIRRIEDWTEPLNVIKYYK